MNTPAPSAWPADRPGPAAAPANAPDTTPAALHWPGPTWRTAPRHQGHLAPLHLVLNNGAGSAQAGAIADGVGPDAGPHRLGRHALHWYQPAHPGDLAATAARAVAAAQASGGVVVALGGDGTINTVAAAANRAQVAMGVVARGTFNLFARQQGLAEDPRQALNDIVDALDQAWLRPVQLGLVNGQPFLVNASLGLYPQLLADREAANRQWGRHPWVALMAGAASLMRPWRSRRYHLAWQSAAGQPLGAQQPAPTAPDGMTAGPVGTSAATAAATATGPAREVADVSTLFVGNNALQWARLGLPGAEQVGAGALGVISLAPATRPTLARLLWRAAMGWLHEEPLITRRTCTALEVSAPTARGRKPVRVAFDGERAWMTLPLRFELAPQPLWLLAPPHGAEQPAAAPRAEAARATATPADLPSTNAMPTANTTANRLPHAPAAPV